MCFWPVRQIDGYSAVCCVSVTAWPSDTFRHSHRPVPEFVFRLYERHDVQDGAGGHESGGDDGAEHLELHDLVVVALVEGVVFPLDVLGEVANSEPSHASSAKLDHDRFRVTA